MSDGLMLLFILIVTCGSMYVGWKQGEEAGRVKFKLELARTCLSHKDTHTFPLSINCPCHCGGKLFSDGRNIKSDMTYLCCLQCGCNYRADDVEKSIDATERSVSTDRSS